MKQFRGGLVFKAHRLLYHSRLGPRVIKKQKRSSCRGKHTLSTVTSVQHKFHFCFQTSPLSTCVSASSDLAVEVDRVQWGNPYIAYPQYSTSPNVARRARSRRAKPLGLPMPLCSTRLDVACYVRASHAALSMKLL